MVIRPRRGDGHRSPRPLVGTAAAALAFVALIAALLLPCTEARATSSADQGDDPITDAVAFLLDQQRADGGFGPGALTPNTVSAIAEHAQTSDTWSAKEAIDAVSATETTDGTTPLDALDALAQDRPGPEAAAQLISRAVVAMGLDPENFDPAADGSPVDLVRQVARGRHQDGSYGSVSATAEAVVALVMVGRAVSEETVAFLEGAQQANGGWNGDGDPDGDLIDPATTGLVVEALVAVGVLADGSTPVTDALAFLARTQDDGGGWPAARGGDFDPDATAWGMGAIRASGHDPTDGCWRPGGGSQPGYVPPSDALVDAQDEDGAITGGLDPVASTSLGVQALVGRWLPTTRAPAVDCSPERSEFPVRPSIVVLAVIAMVLLVGSVSIMRRSEP